MNKESAHWNEIRTFGLVILVAAILAFVGWRLGLVGRTVRVTPSDGAVNVSTTTEIRLRFTGPVTPGTLPPADIQLSPKVAGTTRLDGADLVWSPVEPLTPGLTYTVTARGDLRDERGRRVRFPDPWTFTTHRLQVLFLAPDGEITRLFAINLDEEAPTALTSPDLDVVDYAVAPGGDRIVLSVRGAAGSQDLWLLEPGGGDVARWLDCGGDACGGASWAPDGMRLIFERRAIDPDGAAGPPRLWWAEPVSQESVPVFRETTALGANARLSPDGHWLSYVLPADGSLRLVELATGAETAIVSRTGEAAAWAPNSRALALSSVRLREERITSELLIVQLGDLATVNLSQGLDMTDGSAAWSPDGEWLAFTRGRARVSAGKQLMRVRPDGTKLEALTADAAAQHGPPRWSPDGRALVFQRYEAGTDDLPGIWLLDVASRGLRELAPVGFNPAWLP